MLQNNLVANPTKTENTVFKQEIRNEEDWRKCKKLGSLLGDTEEIMRQKNLAIAASCELNKVWIKKSKDFTEKTFMPLQFTGQTRITL